MGSTLYMPGTKDIRDKVLNKQLDVTSFVMCCEDAIKEEDLPSSPKPWIKDRNGERKITVGCDDGETGSGCTRTEYTKTEQL